MKLAGCRSAREVKLVRPAFYLIPKSLRSCIQDAIRAYTYNTAFANFEETIKGSIEVGKLADLTVLSRKLLRIPTKDILTTEVVYTIVNGKVVYQRLGSSRR